MTSNPRLRERVTECMIFIYFFVFVPVVMVIGTTYSFITAKNVEALEDLLKQYQSQTTEIQQRLMEADELSLELFQIMSERQAALEVIAKQWAEQNHIK